MKKKIIIAVAVIVILAAGGTFYLNHKINSAVKDGKIIKGVSCEGISIGGMTRSEAKDAIESHMKEIHQEKITLYVDDERSSAKIEDLGAFAEADKTVEEAYALGRSGSIFTKYSDVKEKKHKLPVYRKYDKAKFEKNVKKATKKIVAEPRNASVKRKDGKFVVIKEKTGYTLNMNETFANFKKAVEAEKHQFELDVVKKKAKYTSKDMAEIKDVLGTYTTEYGGSPYGRKVNVANGASKINGSMVYPGETLSVYKTVSPFTKENGYALAGSYENGQTVQTYGGGICQVSTTLYNAVIRAELKIVERFPHSMTVHYVPRSADAAIAGTHKDMKFKNTFDTPIYIEGKANGSTITFTVYGKKKDPKRTVEFLSETTQVKESSESTVSDNTLAEGQKVLESYGHTGYSARLWKIVKVNGKQVSKKVFNTSTYMSTPTVYRVGTKKAEKIEETSKTIKEGIVISQETDANTTANAGDTVKIHVSIGTGVNQVVMPNVLGKTEADAKSALEAKNLVVKVEYKENTDKENGEVLEQSIKSGENIDEGTEVTITVNKLAEMKEATITINVKSLTGGYEVPDKENTNTTNTTGSSSSTTVKEKKLTVKVGEDKVYDKKVDLNSTNIQTKISGKGTVTVKVYVDDILKSQKDINLNTTSSYTFE